MPNESERAYGLTTLCPLRDDGAYEESFAAIVRARLRDLPLDEQSPWARVPNVYLCRLFVLDEVTYQGSPARSDRLKSKYLAFVCDFHGTLDPFLRGVWENASDVVSSIWEFCLGFKGNVNGAASFARYIKKCQVTTTFYFNGSTDEPLAEQLKALYLKQEFGKFAEANQGKGAAELQRAFAQFVERVEPANLAGPTWRAGASSLAVADVDAREIRRPA
jgi:hypothetical protein